METLTASLDTVKKLASQTNEQDVQLRALEREAKTERDLLESYLAKYREATARENINAAPPEARIISRASPAIKPAYPKKLPTVLIAAFAAFALSAGFTVTGALLAPAPPANGLRLRAGMHGRAWRATRVDAPPLMPMAAPPARHGGARLLAVSTVEQIAKSMRQAGDAGRRVIVVGAMRNVGTTYAAISLARALAQGRQCGAGRPGLRLAQSVGDFQRSATRPASPNSCAARASFGDIITGDQYSPVHLVATGNVGNDARRARRLADAGDDDRGAGAQLRSRGASTSVPPPISRVERLAPLAARAVLVAADPANPATKAARERLMMAGIADVR